MAMLNELRVQEVSIYLAGIVNHVVRLYSLPFDELSKRSHINYIVGGGKQIL